MTALGAHPTSAIKQPPSASPGSPSCCDSLFYSAVRSYWTPAPPLSYGDLDSVSGILDVNCVVSHAKNSAFLRDAAFYEKFLL